MTGFDARGYLCCHGQRVFEEPALTAEEAAASLSPYVTAKTVRPALIATAGGRELLCWECRCRTAEGRECVVYIDAATGAEARVLLVSEDENGTSFL